MKKKVFISYVFEDASYKGEIEKWLKEARLIVLSKNRNEITQQNAEQSAKEVTAFIAQSKICLILVGNNTHNSQWVAREINIAKSLKVPCYWIRLANRTGGPPPELSIIAELVYDRAKITQLLNALNII